MVEVEKCVREIEMDGLLWVRILHVLPCLHVHLPPVATLIACERSGNRGRNGLWIPHILCVSYQLGRAHQGWRT